MAYFDEQAASGAVDAKGDYFSCCPLLSEFVPRPLPMTSIVPIPPKRPWIRHWPQVSRGRNILHTNPQKQSSVRLKFIQFDRDLGAACDARVNEHVSVAIIFGLHDSLTLLLDFEMVLTRDEIELMFLKIFNLFF